MAINKLDLNGKLSGAIVFPLGFFLEIAMFELIALPFAFFQLKTTTLTFTFTFIILILSAVSMLAIRENTIKLEKPNNIEWLYVVGFACLFIWQLVNAVRLDFTIMSADDNAYVTWANDAVYFNRMFLTNYATGVAERFNLHRAMQTSLIFPSILSLLSGIPVITIEHCILQVFYLVLAYSVYYYMADVLYDSLGEKFVFLIFVSLLYIYGYYSQYNTSFRLLMPNYQGKAILAVSLTPLLFGLAIEILTQEYKWEIGLLLLFLSVAAVALTMIGAVTVIAAVGIPIVSSMLSKKRQLKHLLYIPFICFFPTICIIILLFHLFAL